MNVELQNYYSGTSGLLLPVPNKLFYPEDFQNKSRLCYYSSLVNSIEINSSFYKIPQASTIAKWAADVPQQFRFTFKLFKEITHRPDLAFDPTMVTQFMQVINQVAQKKGCVLVQFPPSVRIGHFKQLEFLMSVLRNQDPQMEWKMAFEFRHSSLYEAEMMELLAHYQMGMVVHDKSPANSPLVDTDLDFIYLRFHGPEGNYRGSYSEQVLAEYASYILEWLQEGKKVFVYFNNTMGQAHGNLQTLKQMVSHIIS